MRIRAAIAIVPFAWLACGAPGDRTAVVANTMLGADEVLARTRPALVAGKYRRMAADLYAFHRGSVPIYARDAQDGASALSRSRFALESPMPVALGDAHVENFGVLIAGDGSFALEPNDFDAADRWPYLWDVRRLTTSVAIAARLAGAGDGREAARSCAEAYARAAIALADGAPRERAVRDPASPILDDVFRRSESDARKRDELAAMTVVRDGARRLVRGALDPAQPDNVLQDLPSFAYTELPAVLAGHRRTLLAPPPPEWFTVIDAARELGSGVASWPRVRAIVLVRGPTDAIEDDVLLEIKEVAESGATGRVRPGVFYDGPEARILETTRAAWARPDAAPLWGTSAWAGLHVQVRLESEGQKTLRTARMTGALGTEMALIDLATRLGALLARVHAAPLGDGTATIVPIARRFRDDIGGFADEQADVSLSYAAQVERDYTAFKDALARYGPLLGLPADTLAPPAADLTSLLGSPP